MSGTLYVVATPIGNLEDITLRALRVLREADVIAAEDTRRTARLLSRHGIPTPSVSFHEHNTRARLPQLLSRLEQGQSVALVTDAGTPSVSDPGVELVAACVARGIPVDPVPGVSAPLTAAVASGFPLDPLTIYGFPPSRSKDRTSWLSALSGIPGTVTFFEAPHRVQAMLRDAAAILGDRPIMLGRELTKAHQEFLHGTAADLADRLENARGEFTVVVGPAPPIESASELPDDTQVAEEFGRTALEPGTTRRDAVAAVAKKFGRPVREVYAAIERAKKSGE